MAVHLVGMCTFASPRSPIFTDPLTVLHPWLLFVLLHSTNQLVPVCVPNTMMPNFSALEHGSQVDDW